MSAEILDELTAKSLQPSCAYTFFISQNWCVSRVPSVLAIADTASVQHREGGVDNPHPDNDKNTKLRWMCRLREHLGLPPRELWIWIDIMSVPQDDRTLQMKAIGSLCAYTHLISRFIPLVRDADAWQRVYNEALEYASGSLKIYCTRGWCRLELLAALAPKKNLKFSDADMGVSP